MSETGRYQLIQHPTCRQDQFLLDTVSGATWRLLSFEGPLAWKPITKLNSEAEVDSFRESSRKGSSS